METDRTKTPEGATAKEAVEAAWPKPSLSELGAAAGPWCSTPWADVLAGPKHAQVIKYAHRKM